MTTIDGDDDSYDVIDKGLRKIWLNDDGQNHRDGDLPAIIRAYGDVFYCKDVKYHRDGDLPAMIYADGYVEYWIEGKKQK